MLNPCWILCNASTRDLGGGSSVCVYVYIHVCRCAHMSTYDICLSIALHITFCDHHFSLTGQWALASNCSSTHPPPHIQHCSYRCIHHTWPLHRCWSSDLKSSHLLTKPSGQPSSPSLNSFGVSGYRHILSLSPDDLFFFTQKLYKWRTDIFSNNLRDLWLGHMICWKHEKPEGISGQVGRSKPPGVPFTHNEQRQKSWNSSPTRSHDWKKI